MMNSTSESQRDGILVETAYTQCIKSAIGTTLYNDERKATMSDELSCKLGALKEPNFNNRG